MNEEEINKAFDEEYIKYRDAFPKDYDIPALTQPEQEPPKYSFKAHWEADGRIGIAGVVIRLDGGAHVLQQTIDPPQRTWVGLTDDEIERLIHNFGADPWTLLDEVDARLKARNT